MPHHCHRVAVPQLTALATRAQASGGVAGDAPQLRKNRPKIPQLEAQPKSYGNGTTGKMILPTFFVQIIVAHDGLPVALHRRLTSPQCQLLLHEGTCANSKGQQHGNHVETHHDQSSAGPAAGPGKRGTSIALKP